MRRPTDVDGVRDLLVRKGHVDPVVLVTTPDGRASAGDPDARFEIGSVTKVFTATLLAVLAVDGVVRLTDQVGDLLPAGTRLAPKVATITLEQLACHRSGLPRLPPGLWRRGLSRKAAADPYADVDEAALLAALARVRVRGRPDRARVRYSNLGAGLLGHLLGVATGRGYEASVLERVVRPLGMTSTSFVDEPLHQGHHRGRAVGPWHLGALAGAGGLRSSATDLATFLEVVRDGGTALDAAVAETLRPRAHSWRGGGAVGLGWFLSYGGDLLLHGGGTLGARSEVRLDRRTGRGVVVLGDGRGSTWQAARILLDLPGAPGRPQSPGTSEAPGR